MNPHSTCPGGPARKGFAARVALAAALAGGLVIGGTVLSAPAIAKEKKNEEPEQERNTKPFAEAYQPVAAIVNAADGDYAAAKAQIPTVVAAIGNEADRMTAGQLILVLGNKLTDHALQRQGLELMLQSGKVDPARVAQFQFFVGNLAFDAKDYEAARTALLAAIDHGYTDNDPQGLVAAAYFQEGKVPEGLQYYKDEIAKVAAAGKPVPDAWLRRSLKAAYDAKLTAQVNEFSAMLVRYSPSDKNWADAIQVVSGLNQLDPVSQLDLLRLVRANGLLKDRHDFVSYVQAADPRRLSNEVLAVLAEGLQAGVFTADDQYYKQTREIADPRSAADRKDAAAVDPAKEDSGLAAQADGDLLFSLGDYAKAAALYQVAIDKGTNDVPLALTHLGIAQTELGNYDAAKTAFEKVTGPRAPVAQMWLSYVDVKTNPPPPQPPAAPPQTGA